MVDIATVMELFTLAGIMVSGVIFARLAIKAKSIGSFRFQLSLFMLVWVVSEVPHVLQTLGLIDATPYDTFGLAAHMTSMAIFAIFVGIRSANFVRVKPLPIAATKPPALPTGAIEK